MNDKNQFALALAGIALGCAVGYFSAQHFALWGGWLLMGEPYSPARNNLVPIHVLFFATILGVIGFIWGCYLDRKNNDKP